MTENRDVKKQVDGREVKKWFTANQLLDLKVKEGMWLWDTYIPRNDISGITGASDCGKSTFLRQLALAIATGAKEFLGKPLHPVTCKAIYVATEDAAIALQQSLQKQVTGMGLDRTCLDRVYFLIDDQEVFSEVETVMKKAPVDLLIIDSLGDTFEGDANNFVAARAYMKKLKSLIRDYDCSVILLHHNTKNSEKGAPDKNKLNGSQALEAKMRSLFELRLADKNNERFLTILKGNYIPQELKNRSAVIEFDGKYLLFNGTGKLKDGGSILMLNGGVKYDPKLWVPRMLELRKESGLSYEDAQNYLIQTCPNENVPGVTWFKDHCKEQPPV